MARAFLFAEPLKSLEKKGKTAKQTREIGKRKKARKSKKARIGGSGFLLSRRESGKEKTQKHKQISGIVLGLVVWQKLVYVSFWGVIPYGGETHKQNPPKIPGQSREMFVYVLFSLSFFIPKRMLRKGVVFKISSRGSRGFLGAHSVQCPFLNNPLSARWDRQKQAQEEVWVSGMGRISSRQPHLSANPSAPKSRFFLPSLRNARLFIVRREVEG